MIKMDLTRKIRLRIQNERSAIRREMMLFPKGTSGRALLKFQYNMTSFSRAMIEHEIIKGCKRMVDEIRQQIENYDQKAQTD